MGRLGRSRRRRHDGRAFRKVARQRWLNGAPALFRLLPAPRGKLHPSSAPSLATRGDGEGEEEGEEEEEEERPGGGSGDARPVASAPVVRDGGSVRDRAAAGPRAIVLRAPGGALVGQGAGRGGEGGGRSGRMMDGRRRIVGPTVVHQAGRQQ